MTSTQALRIKIDRLFDQVSQSILGKHEQIKLTLACLLARGHLLIEDIPGVGKTTLAHALAKSLSLDFKRVQFTSDLMPSDILGGSVLNKDTSSLNFKPGPVFTSLLLADEINRATPRCQSALLEAMEEQQVSIDGFTHALPQPFFVIATQNPREQIGTFDLPESQMDRFHMRLSLGYPDESAERTLLRGKNGRKNLEEIEACLSKEQILAIQAEVEQVFVSEPVLDYLQRIIKYTREASHYETGLSPRAGLALRQCAQAWAYLEGREHVLPEDVQHVLPHVLTHRLQASHLDHEASSLDLATQLNCIAIS